MCWMRLADTLNYGGVSALLLVSAPTSSYSYRENTFREIEFCH